MASRCHPVVVKNDKHIKTFLNIAVKILSYELYLWKYMIDKIIELRTTSLIAIFNSVLMKIFLFSFIDLNQNRELELIANNRKTKIANNPR